MRPVTLSIDEDIYKEFQDICRKEGLVASKQVQLFMADVVKNSMKRG